VATNAAFEILYREYYVRVYGLCRRLLSSAELAEDAAQETFMRAYRNFHKFKSERPFWYWIASIANNHCIDLLRQRHRTDALFGDEADELEVLPATEMPVLSELISLEQAETLNAAVAGLAVKYRVPIVLAYFDQFSYDEIAEQLKISRTHVGVLLLRAKQQLRTALAAAGENSR
jgi:RNA polymerase sigma-70 factor, ECF subfamily